MVNGIVQPALERQGGGEVAMGEVIVLGHVQRAAEQRLAVLPKLELVERDCEAKRDNEDRRARWCCGSIAKAVGGVVSAPRKEDEDADQREIGIAVGVRLATDLDEAHN